MTQQITVAKRTETGKRRMKRLRQSGKIPAVLYGHGQEVLSLSVPTDQLTAAIRHGSHLVDLGGDLSESALIKDVVWDTYGLEVLHVDLARVDKTEVVEVTVAVHLRGVAPGISQGGVLHHLLHEVEMSCTAASIPDHLEVSVNHLELGKMIHASELKLPEGATLLTPGDKIVVECVLPVAAPDEEAVAGEGAEPEVIGRKKEDGEAEA
jgi:large subunit ribosomal protein L25